MVLDRGKLYIKKRTVPEWVMLFIFTMPLLLAFFQEFLHLPGVVKYSIDLAWIFMFAYMFLRKHIVFEKKVAPFMIFTVVFFLYTLVVYAFNMQSLFYYLWGLRNNFRYYIAFLGFATMFEYEDADVLLKMLDKLFWVNAVITLFQFFVLGYSQDFLGGIFGVERGCNANSIIFFSIIIGRSILLFLNDKESIFVCMLKCATSLVISAMAELKVFFVLFMLILVISLTVTKFSWKKLLLLLVSAVLVIVSSSILSTLFSNSSVSFESILEQITASQYATEEDLGRFSAIPTISSSILTTIPKKLFGMGLGNCDTSAFALCNTPFFKAHSAMHYTWFSSAFLFLETGYIGLYTYMLFFVISFVFSVKCLKKGKTPLFGQLGIIASILCVVLTFYNSSLRMEVGYIIYFVLSLPVIGLREPSEN